MSEFRTCQTKPSCHFISYSRKQSGDKPKPKMDPSIILGLALNPPGEDACVAYDDFRGNEIL